MIKNFLPTIFTTNISRLRPFLLRVATFAVMFFALLALTAPFASVQAQTCSSVGQCLNGQRCIDIGGGVLAPGGGACGGAAVIGGVGAPQGVDQINLMAGGSGNIGIIIFISRVIRLLTIIGGIWVMINFVVAGYQYISGFGDSGAHVKVRDRATWSVVGIVLIVAAYTLAGLVGLIFFGDAGYILNPQLQGAV